MDTPCSFTRHLPLEREAAFELVVDRFADWWPREYTFSGEDLEDIGIEPMAGGACYEQARGGARIVWGTVLSIERPLFLRLAWQIGPGREVVADPAAASRVVIEFRAEGEGTRVELSHGDFLRHGEGGEHYRSVMASEGGWPFCLDKLVEAARARAHVRPRR
ncbi:SRPBCC family protein [Stappia taiwanensis]|uniref:SRPBCC family protein n=1 Tax=Stappia taiwanensis TaxID=992267 RepID=UPI001AD93166|nr:SRPBCC family protein [Stappia taiwanensis]